MVNLSIASLLGVSSAYFCFKRIYPPSNSNQPHRVKRKSTLVSREFNRLDYMEASSCELIQELQYLDQPTCNILFPDHILYDQRYKTFSSHLSPLYGEAAERKVSGGGFLLDEQFVDSTNFVISHVDYNASANIQNSDSFLRAGPRKNIFWDVKKVKAAIVTCGDLLPGLNSVIRELVMSLHYNYEVREVFGVQYSYKGFIEYEFVKLDPEKVKSIHHQGGSILGISDRDIDAKQIVKSLKKNKFNQLYIIGDFQDHIKLQTIYQEIKEQGLDMVIAGIPKSIDNYFPLSDNSFGFETQIENSLKVINSAVTMCRCKEYGISIVKLNGKHTGYVCLEASLSSSEVNVCIIPEMEFELQGQKGLLKYVETFVKKHKYCVIVVAEGAGQALLDQNLETLDIGAYLKSQISMHCRNSGLGEVPVAYYDACHLVKTVEANPLDQKYASALAQNAIHGLMAGFTNFTVAKLNGRSCYLPLQEILNDKFPRQILASNRMWQRLLQKTQQPQFINQYRYY